jgi:hypothetical protein
VKGAEPECGTETGQIREPALGSAIQLRPSLGRELLAHAAQLDYLARIRFPEYVDALAARFGAKAC